MPLLWTTNNDSVVDGVVGGCVQKGTMRMDDTFLPVRQILSAKDITLELGQNVSIHHVDITCDGCECEPIIGKRFRCTVCEDIDLCEVCTRGLLGARVTVAKEVGALPVPKGPSQRRTQWIRRIQSDDTRTKWSALQETVPCLHPSHVLEMILSGPERAVVYTFPSTPGDTRSTVATSSSNVSSCEISLEQFLRKIQPSRTSCEDAAWIHASIGMLHYTTAEEERRILTALDDWERIIRETPTIVSSNVDAVAQKYNLKHGKWMIFSSCDEVDNVWKALCRSLLIRGLGSCSEIKVSTHSPTDTKHVILAYTDDYKNETDVYGVAQGIKSALRSSGVDALADKRLLYKPDIYTHLNIYSKNPYHLKPTIYTDKFM